MEIILRLSFTLFSYALVVSSAGNWTPPSDLLELCPYTSFCEYNMSKQFSFDYSAEFAPCCRPCSCSKLCGLHRNCCHRDLDMYPKKINNEMLCHSTFGQNVSPLWSQYDINYKMIDKCLMKVQELENANGCEQKYNSSNSTFHPVYSASKNQTYISQQCADCNNVTDGIEWQMAVNCISESTFYDEAERLILGKSTSINACVLNFIPPKGFDLTFSKCEPDVIRTCNMTGIVSERDESWDQCSEFNATFIVINAKALTLRYANIFCWMCNTRRYAYEKLMIEDACPSGAVGGEDSKELTGMPLTVILDMVDKEPQHTEQTIAGRCLANEVFIISFQNSCRQRRCPVGQIMLNNKCDFYSSQWYGGPFSVLLKLTPLNSRVIPMEFFSSMPSGIRSNNMATWLDRGSLKIWQVLPLIQGTENQTTVKYLVTKVTYPYKSVNPFYLHTAIKRALEETWMLRYNGVEFRLNATLNDVLNYSPIQSTQLQDKASVKDKLWTNPSKISDPTIYNSSVARKTVVTTLKLSYNSLVCNPRVASLVIQQHAKYSNCSPLYSHMN